MNYDLEQVYDDEISPLMTKIIAICKREGMPMVASFQYQIGDENGPAFCTTILAEHPDKTSEMKPTAPKLWRAAEALRPERPFAIAETIVTNPDGSKVYTSRLVR